MSFCTVEAGLSLCRVSADERAALENEIARSAPRKRGAQGRRAAPARRARPPACPRRRTWSGCCPLPSAS